MFPNGIGSDEQSLSEAISTYRLHEEAINRFNEMNSALINSGRNLNPVPTQLDVKFELLSRMMAEEKSRADRLLREAFERKQDEEKKK